MANRGAWYNARVQDRAEAGSREIGGRYAHYVLVILTLVYVFNFIDRQILSILAPEIQRELGISDADMSFLYGTAFAVFYAVFGIPLGRLADVWTRKSLIALGLAVWSGMTAISGTAGSFASLALYRIGVGVGEASASPAAYSLLGDWFSPRMRGFALAVYSSGVYIGAGIGIFLGGWIVEGWGALYPEGGAPFGLRGWQVAFFAVGLPGIALALWVWSLREPRRGQSEGMPEGAPHPHPFREFASELSAILPPFSWLSLARAGGARAVATNFLGAAAIVLAASVLIALVGNPPQWIALGLGCYCAFSWAQGLTRRDPTAFALIFRSRSLILLGVGFASIAFVTYGAGFWGPSFFKRVHGVSEGEIATLVGTSRRGRRLARRLARRRALGSLEGARRERASLGGLAHGRALGTERALHAPHGQPRARLRVELRVRGGLAALARRRRVGRERAGAAAPPRARLGVLPPADHVHRPRARPLHDGHAVGQLRAGRRRSRQRAPRRDEPRHRDVRRERGRAAPRRALPPGGGGEPHRARARRGRGRVILLDAAERAS